MRDRVIVLLATLNGSDHLPRQLESLAVQTHPTIDILASDDGSSDTTLSILEAFSWSKGRMDILRGPGAGFAANFSHLIRHASPYARWYAFCDQDDEWDANKIERAISVLTQQPNSRPALYCGRTRLINDKGQTIGQSPRFTQPPSFRNALVQSIAGGNTMVFNRAAFQLLRKTAFRTSFVSHDWWAYLMVTGAGGFVYYDSWPAIDYRQHGGNSVGDNMRLRARIDRIRRLFSGYYAGCITHNLDALDACRDLLSPDAQNTIAQFNDARRQSGFRALQTFKQIGVHRQSRMANIAMYCAALTGKI